MYTKLEFDEMKNSFLCELMHSYIDLHKEDSLAYNREETVNYFINNPDVFLSFLSPTTLLFLKDNYQKEDTHFDLSIEEGYNEDFLILIRLGVIDIDDNAYLNPIYNSVFDALFAYLDKDKYKELELVNVIKGLIDINGYIGYEELRYAMLDIPEYKDIAIDLDFYSLLKRSALINCYCIVRETEFYRFEMGENIENIEHFRSDEAKPFNIYVPSLEMIEQFANTFSFEKEKSFANPEMATLHLSHMMSFVLFLAKNETIIEKFNKEDVETIDKMEQDYPKWLLKGHSIKEYMELTPEDYIQAGDEILGRVLTNEDLEERIKEQEEEAKKAKASGKKDTTRVIDFDYGSTFEDNDIDDDNDDPFDDIDMDDLIEA